MTNNNHTFEDGRDRILKVIARLEGELETWKGHLNHLEQAERALKSLEGEPARKASSPPPRRQTFILTNPQADTLIRTNGDTAGKYAPMGITDAIKDVLRSSNAALNPSMVRDAILAGGFVVKGKNVHVTVGTTLKRLAARGVVTENHRAGKRWYQATPSLL